MVSENVKAVAKCGRAAVWDKPRSVAATLAFAEVMRGYVRVESCLPSVSTVKFVARSRRMTPRSEFFQPARILFQVRTVSTDEMVKVMGIAKVVPRFA